MKVNRGLLRGLVVAAASAALIVPSAAFAQGPGNGHGAGGGRGGGVGGGRGNGGGGSPGAETPNNLSVPAIFVSPTGDANPFSLNCGTLGGTLPDALDPSGTPQYVSTAEEPGYYWLQGISTWQAQCAKAATASAPGATAAWGDNLVGEGAALKVGSPIRVEMGLLEETDSAGMPVTSMTGYTVAKLEPNELDRVSQYGTMATVTTNEAGENVFTPNPVNPYPEVRLWDSLATLTIEDPSGTALPGVTATAEVNSTGRVVYGYNLRVSTPGKYTLIFTAPDISISSANGNSTVSEDGHTVTLTIEVTEGGGGGGHHGGGGGG